MWKPSKREMIANVAAELEHQLKQVFDDTESLEQAQYAVHHVLLAMSEWVIKEDGHRMLGILYKEDVENGKI